MIDIHNINSKKKSNSIKLIFKIGKKQYKIERTMDKAYYKNSIINKLFLYT